METKVLRLSQEELAADIQGSLETMRVDCIDLYYLHRDDPQRPVADMLDVLHENQQAGKIGYYACSNWTPERIREARVYANRKGYTGFVGNQMRWSIGSFHMRPPNDTTMCVMDQATSDLHRELNLAAIPYSSQAGGFFSKLSADPASEVRGSYYTDGNVKMHRYLESVGSDLGLSISQVVLAYFWSHPFVSIPIVGCRTIEQMKDSLRAVGRRLPDEAIQVLTEDHGLPQI
jgi:aryl-alcohol dehydrogenase-like predicted oxidoreductase